MPTLPTLFYFTKFCHVKVANPKQMFHCHNLVHEDHAMMAAFNVSDLGNFNYPPQTSRFINPVDPRFTSRPYDPTVQTLDHVNGVILPFFSDLNGYEFHDEVEEALVTYWSTATKVITDIAPVQSEFNGRKMKRVPEAEAKPTPVAVPFKA